MVQGVERPEGVHLLKALWGNGTKWLLIVAGGCLALATLIITLVLWNVFLKPDTFAPIQIVSPGVIVNKATPGIIVTNPTVHVGSSVTTRRSVCNTSSEDVQVTSQKWWQEEGDIDYRSNIYNSNNTLPPGCQVIIFTHPMPPEVVAASQNQFNAAPFVYWTIQGTTTPLDGNGRQGAPVVWTTVRVKVIP